MFGANLVKTSSADLPLEGYRLWDMDSTLFVNPNFWY